MMRAAVVDAIGQTPRCREVADPVVSEGWQLGRVRAAAIKNIERMLVAGSHYGSAQLRMPARVGLDAVLELPGGRRVYAGATPPAGAMADYLAVDPERVIDIPSGIDDPTAAALPNAAVSAWFGLEYGGRVRPGQSVLVLGATGVTGGLAVQLAKHRFGAATVVAVGRNAQRLEELRIQGADRVFQLGHSGNLESEAATLADAVRNLHADLRFDVVLDYLWGRPAEQTLQALGNQGLSAAFHRTRYVQIGESAGPVVQLAAATLRSAGVELVGQGAGSIPAEAMARVSSEILPAIFELVASGVLSLETVSRPLDQVHHAWNEPVGSGVRVVLVP